MSEIRSGVPTWLTLAAAPTFAMMALTTGLFPDSSNYALCSAEPSAIRDGMVPMYVLMSAFHLPPWLRLISGRWRHFCPKAHATSN